MIKNLKRVKKLCRGLISSDTKVDNRFMEKLSLFYCLDVGTNYNSDIERFLTTDEIARAQKFHFPEDKYTYAAAHAFLNFQLLNRLGCPMDRLRFSYNSYKKPIISGSKIRFNLSHSKNSWAVVIAENCEIGVDIEHINDKRDLLQITEYYFTPYEQNRVNYADNKVLEFYKIWTRKEAYLKMKGIGINIDFHNIDVEKLCHNKEEMMHSMDISCYIETYEFPKHVISTAQCKHLPVIAEEIASEKLNESLSIKISKHQPIQISL